MTAASVAAQVADPELPMVTLADLGILRSVRETDGRVVVEITPTYSGCPALHQIDRDLRRGLRAAGYAEVDVRTSLSPAWSSDWITAAGRRKLAAAGIAPPGPAPVGPVPLRLGPTRRTVPCPQCGSDDTVETAPFSGTACKALYRCRACAEPFEYVKEH